MLQKFVIYRVHVDICTCDHKSEQIFYLNLFLWLSPLLCAARVPVAPVITTPLMEQNVPYQGQATFECLATGSPYPEYRWFKNGEAISDQNLPILYFSNVQVSDRGLYSCSVTNSEGSDESQSIYLRITGALNFAEPVCVHAWWSMVQVYIECLNVLLKRSVAFFSS